MGTVAKIAAGTAVACYVAGLLTVSSYLYRTGVSLADPSALRARFAYTGAEILVIVAATVGFLMLGLALGGRLGAEAEQSEPVTHRRARPQSAVAVVVAVVPLAALVCLLRWAGKLPFSDSTLYAKALTLWLAAGVGGGAALAATVALLERRDRGRRWIAVVALSAYGFVFLIFYATLVSDYLYPLIPEQFGGGRPQRVQLLLSNDGAQLAARLGVTSCQRSLSCPVSLIWRGEDFVAVRTASGQIVQLDKSLILGARPG